MTIVDLKNARPRKRWAKDINAAWGQACRHAKEAFFETGRLLIAAKDELEHGEWLKLLGDKQAEGELAFGGRVARMLVAIARDGFLQIGSNASNLPPDYTTIYQLSRLRARFPEKFEELWAAGMITPSLQRNEINRLLRIEQVQGDEARVLDLVPVAGKFRTLVIDPAWDYEWLSIAARAKPGYAMETLDQLRARDVAAWADDEVGCHLYCWVTNNFMTEGAKLVEHWGFQHRTVLTWLKPPPFGLGSYFRNSTEHVLFATRGETTTRPAAASMPTHFEAPRGEHSEKPEAFYDIVRKASYPPYGEANQREARRDFTNLFAERESEALEAAE